jgi:hypothetical protein
MNVLVITPYSLRASASPSVDEYTYNSYRGNHQKFSTQSTQQLVRKDKKVVLGRRGFEPGAHTRMAEFKAEGVIVTPLVTASHKH